MWTSGGIPQPCPLSPYMTAQFLWWNPSGLWNPKSPRTWNGNVMSTQSSKTLADNELPVSAREVQPTSGTANSVLNFNHRGCSLHIHHCLVWSSCQTRHAETITDSQDCRNNHWHQPAKHPGPVQLQREERHNLLHLLPSGPHYRTLYTNTNRHINSSFPHAITKLSIS